MTLDKLQKDMIAAMKAHEKPRKDAISLMIAAVKKVAIDEGHRDDIKEDLVDRVLLKELKTAKEQVDTCPNERAELKAEYTFRYEVIKEYAPGQMDENDLKAYIQEKFTDVLASGEKGIIMRTIMADLKGKADGKLINKIVAELTK